MNHVNMKLRSLAAVVSLLGSATIPVGGDPSAKAESTDSDQLKHVVLYLSNEVTMELVKVPAGTFLMGTDASQRFRVPDDRENPRREVTISRDFQMGVCEVTRGQFAAFAKDTGYLTQAEREGWAYAWNGRVWDKVYGASWKKVGFEQTDEHPVVCVSFDDAVAFCRWLSNKTGKAVRLPSEAQWEYACRAGSTTAYVWGDDWDDGDGWANAADAAAKKQFPGWRTFSWDDGYVFTAPVGRYKANSLGLHDMTGNVWEWCSDWYDEDYYKTAPNIDPLGPSSGTLRVLRGGAWLSSPPRCRSAGRTGCNLRGWYCDFIAGFRVVVEADDWRELPAVSPPNRADWPDWRGPQRDGLCHDMPDKLPEKATLLWTQETTGPGISGVVVADGRVIVADKSADGEHDIWRCLDAETGNELWQLKYAAGGEMRYTNSPRATPVVHGGKAYLLGAFGDLHCVRTDTGEVLWKRHLIDDFDAALPIWGMTATPLIVDDSLIVNPGAEAASLVALDRNTGKVVWQTHGAPAAYASFIVADFNGKRQIIGYDSASLGGWDASTGERLWELVAPREGDYNVPTPVAVRNRLLVASENNSARLYGFTGQAYQAPVRIEAEPKHRFDALAPDMVSPIVYDGMVFGNHDSYLYCLDANTLECLWKARDLAYYSFATLIAGDGHVLILTIDGELLLVRADRTKYDLISRLRLFPGERTEIWSHPAPVAGRLYIRNKNRVCCLLLPREVNTAESIQKNTKAP